MDPHDIVLTNVYCSTNGYKCIVYENYISLSRDKIRIVLSFGDDCLQNSDRCEPPEILNKKESEYYNNTNSQIFVLYVRAKNASLLEYIIPYDSILQFYNGEVPRHDCYSRLMVQYIGYSYQKSSISHVIEGNQGGCCSSPGPDYHVILTKKVRYEKELGFRHFHFPNGTSADEYINIDEFSYSDLRTHDTSYDTYIVENGVIYHKCDRLYRFGGNNSEL